MIDLSPEDRKRIYEEEKARLEAEPGGPTPKPKKKHGCALLALAVALMLVAIVSITIVMPAFLSLLQETDESSPSFPAGEEIEPLTATWNKWNVKDGSYELIGEVSNISQKSYRFVEVRAEFYDSASQIVGVDATYACGTEAILPWAKKPFTLKGTQQPDFKKVIVSIYDYQEVIEGPDPKAGPPGGPSLSVFEKVAGRDHPDEAASLNDQAMSYLKKAKFAQAEPLFKRALEVREKDLGLDHPELAKILDNLAELYRAQGMAEQAEPLLKRSSAIMEKALGPDHPEVATSLHNLAVFYYTQGRYDQAEQLDKRALAIREKAFGPDHHDVAECLESLARLYRALNRTKEAEALEARAALIRSDPPA